MSKNDNKVFGSLKRICDIKYWDWKLISKFWFRIQNTKDRIQNYLLLNQNIKEKNILYTKIINYLLVIENFSPFGK